MKYAIELKQIMYILVASFYRILLHYYAGLCPQCCSSNFPIVFHSASLAAPIIIIATNHQAMIIIGLSCIYYVFYNNYCELNESLGIFHSPVGEKNLFRFFGSITSGSDLFFVLYFLLEFLKQKMITIG